MIHPDLPQSPSLSPLTVPHSRRKAAALTTLQSPNKMPLNTLRQHLRLLHQFLRIILPKMGLFGFRRFMERPYIGCGFQFRDGDESYLSLSMSVSSVFFSSSCDRISWLGWRWVHVRGRGDRRGGGRHTFLLPPAATSTRWETPCTASTRLFARVGSIGIFISSEVMVVVRD